MRDDLSDRWRELWEAHKHRFAPLSRALLALVVVGSVLPLGSIHVPILMAVAGVATVSAALALSRSALLRFPLPGPLALILALTAVTLLQVVPMPLSWLAHLAPANAEVWSGALAPLSQSPPRFVTLSLDPVGTWSEVLKGWTYAAVFVAAAAAGARRGAAWGATLLFGSAVLLAVILIGHGLLDASRIFGIYQARSGGSGFGIGPLVNPNNRAGYLNLGIFAGAGLLAMPRAPLPRWLTAIALAPVIGATLLTGSRGGVLALGTSALLLLYLLRGFVSERGGPLVWRSLLLFSGSAAALGIALTVLAAGPRIQELLLESDTTKLRLAVATVPLLARYPLFGIGRGAFESVFPAFHTAGDNTVFSHPENFPIQWATEWGLVVAVPALIAGAIVLRPRAWGVSRSIPACGLFAAASSFAIQNLFDLGSEVPGLVIAVIAAAGFAWGDAKGDLRPSRSLRGTLVTCGVGALLLALVGWRGMQTLSIDQDELRVSRHQEWPAYRQALAAAMTRHPAEPYFARLGAVGAWRSGGENPLPWLDRALERGMTVGRTHYLLAQYLTPLGKPSQALLELRLAVEYDPPLASRVAVSAVKLTTDREALLRVAPAGAPGSPVLLNLAYAVSATDPAFSLDLLRESIARDPKARDPRILLAKKLLASVESSALESPERSAQAEEALRVLNGVKASAPEALQLRARLLVAIGRGNEAVSYLAKECTLLQDSLPCLATWFAVAQTMNDRRALSEALSAFNKTGCPDPRQCAAAHWAAGNACSALGDSATALLHFEQAASEENTMASWQRVAKYAHDTGRAERALRALRRAEALTPRDRNSADRLNAARHDMLNQLQFGQVR